MPIFALGNAGVTLSLSTFDPWSPLFLGILAGLCLGKPLGIFGTVWCFSRLFKVPVPGNASTGQAAATGMLGGIGFTMSIFIASLAFATAVPCWIWQKSASFRLQSFRGSSARWCSSSRACGLPHKKLPALSLRRACGAEADI